MKKSSLYVVYGLQHDGEPFFGGVFNSYTKANKAIDIFEEQAKKVGDILELYVIESILDRVEDY